MVPFIPRDCWLSLVLPVRGRFPAVRIFRRSRANIWTFPISKIGLLQAILRFSQKPCSWSSAAPDLTKFRSTFRTNRRANQSGFLPERSFAFPRGADGKCVFVWLRHRLFDCGLACFLMGNNYSSYVYFCSYWDTFIRVRNIVILM